MAPRCSHPLLTVPAPSVTVPAPLTIWIYCRAEIGQINRVTQQCLGYQTCLVRSHWCALFDSSVLRHSAARVPRLEYIFLQRKLGRYRKHFQNRKAMPLTSGVGSSCVKRHIDSIRISSVHRGFAGQPTNIGLGGFRFSAVLQRTNIVRHA